MDGNRDFESGLKGDNKSEIIEGIRNNSDAAEDFAGDGDDDWNIYQ